MAKKHKLRKLNLKVPPPVSSETNTDSKIAVFINQSLCQYYRHLYSIVKRKKTKEIIDNFKVANGIIKGRELGSSKHISILHESD